MQIEVLLDSSRRTFFSARANIATTSMCSSKLINIGLMSHAIIPINCFGNYVLAHLRVMRLCSYSLYHSPHSEMLLDRGVTAFKSVSGFERAPFTASLPLPQNALLWVRRGCRHRQGDNREGWLADLDLFAQDWSVLPDSPGSRS